MVGRPDRERIRPTIDGRARLLAAVEMVGPAHAVDTGTLGEYAVLLSERGRTEAEARMPEVAAHLDSGCAPCADDLRELCALAGAPDSMPEPSEPRTGDSFADLAAFTTGSRPESPLPDPAPQTPLPIPPMTQSPISRSVIDSGIHAAGLPDPRAAEAADAVETARRQRLRRIRDWLLVAAAASILLIGLSLVAMAYTASQQSGPARLGLTPLPAASPAVDGTGRASPSGTSCPPSHPIKGNRSSMIYHRPGAEFYDQTRPEDCFASPADAEAAGYRGSFR